MTRYFVRTTTADTARVDVCRRRIIADKHFVFASIRGVQPLIIIAPIYSSIAFTNTAFVPIHYNQAKMAPFISLFATRFRGNFPIVFRSHEFYYYYHCRKDLIMYIILLLHLWFPRWKWKPAKRQKSELIHLVSRSLHLIRQSITLFCFICNDSPAFPNGTKNYEADLHSTTNNNNINGITATTTTATAATAAAKKKLSSRQLTH